jgi:hypothetical protein
MATAAKPKPATPKVPPTPNAKQARLTAKDVPLARPEAKAAAIADGALVEPDGTIKRFKGGQLVSTTPPPKANGKLAAKVKGQAKAPTQPAAKPVPRLGMPASADTPEHFVAKRGTEDIYGFTPLDLTDPSKGVRMRHYRGYDLLREARFSEPHATKFVHELIHDKGFEYVDGVNMRLVDEDV